MGQGYASLAHKVFPPADSEAMMNFNERPSTLLMLLYAHVAGSSMSALNAAAVAAVTSSSNCAHPDEVGRN